MRKFINYLQNKKKEIKNISYERGALIVACVCITLLLIFLSNSAKSQVYTDWSSGYDITQHSGIGAMGFGFTQSRIDVDGGISFSFNRGVQSNNFMHMRIGYAFADMIVPQIGYYYNLRSSDDKRLNYSSIGYSLKFVLPVMKYFKINGTGFFVQSIYVNKQVQALAGLHAVFY